MPQPPTLAGVAMADGEQYVDCGVWVISPFPTGDVIHINFDYTVMLVAHTRCWPCKAATSSGRFLRLWNMRAWLLR